MKKKLSLVLIAIPLLCYCDSKKEGRYSYEESYEESRMRHINYVEDTANYVDHYLVVGDDGNGFIPISDMLEPLKFGDEIKSELIDTLICLYNATQMLDAMIYDCSTIDRYEEFVAEPYADAISSIDVSGIADVELCEAFLALSEALARDIRKGLRTDTIYYEEVRRLHEVMDNLFGNFVDSHYSESNYDCSKYVPDYETIHAKAIVDTAHYRDELLQMIFNEKNFEKQCIYAREFAYANWHNVNGNPVDVVAAIESLLITTSYSPLLFDLWLIWRTALQGGVLSGISNDSSMYNLLYNGMRGRAAYRYLTRLNENPTDKLAFDELMKLIHKSSITRNSGCYFGNNCFLDQMDIYRECMKK